MTTMGFVRPAGFERIPRTACWAFWIVANGPLVFPELGALNVPVQLSFPSWQRRSQPFDQDTLYRGKNREQERTKYVSSWGISHIFPFPPEAFKMSKVHLV